jgi:phage-related protein
LPILDWFHIAMRLQHLEQIAGALATDNPPRVAAKAMIAEEVERLHWRLWNGKAKDAQINIDRIRAVVHHFQGEEGQRKSIAPSRKLWTALHALDGYLTEQSDWLVNYAERYRAGLRVGTAITEGTANFLVNRRMNKSHMWTAPSLQDVFAVFGSDRLRSYVRPVDAFAHERWPRWFPRHEFQTAERPVKGPL